MITQIRSRVKTAASQLYTQSSLLEEENTKFKHSWQLIDSAEQIKGISYQTYNTKEPRPFNKTTINTTTSLSTEHELQSGKIYDVRQMEFYYFKIKLRNQKSPLHCQILCDGDFQIVISHSNPYPTKFNCDQVIKSRNWTLRFLHEQNLYISFVSKKCTELKFIIKFGLQEHSKVIRPLTQELSNSNYQISRIPQDIVNQNIKEQTKSLNKFQTEVQRSNNNLRILKVVQKQRVATAQSKRLRAIDYQQKQLQHEGNIIKRLLEQKLKQKHIFEVFWFEMIYLAQMADIINRLFVHRKKVIQRNRMAAFKIRMKFRKLRNTMAREKGELIEDRVKIDCQMALKTYCHQINKVLILRQFKKIVPILAQRAEIYLMKYKMVVVYNKTQLIRRKFIQFMMRVKEYKQEMLTKWDQFISKHYQQQLKLKQQDRDKRQVAWFLQLQDKEFQKMMQTNFLNSLMRERIRNLIYQQKLIKSMRQEVREARIKQRMAQDLIEQQIYKQRIHKLTGDVVALQMKSELFTRSDITKYMLQLMDQFIIIQEDLQSISGSSKAQNKKHSRRGRVSVFRQQ